MIEITYKPSIPEQVIELDDLKLEITRYGETYIKVNFPDDKSEIVPLQVIEYSNIIEFEWKCECGTFLHEDAWKKKDSVLESLNTLIDKIVLHRSQCLKFGFSIQRAIKELYTLQGTEDVVRAIAIFADILVHLFNKNK